MSDNSVTIRGVTGDLYWGYHLAGTVRAWTVTRTGAGPCLLEATIGAVDTFRVSQRPLVFVVQHQYGSWRWPIETLQIVDTTLTASIRPQEESYDVVVPMSDRHA